MEKVTAWGKIRNMSLTRDTSFVNQLPFKSTGQMMWFYRSLNSNPCISQNETKLVSKTRLQPFKEKMVLEWQLNSIFLVVVH